MTTKKNEENTIVIDLDYPAPSIGKNLASRFFDAFTFFLIGVILVIPFLFIVQGNSTYQSWISKQDEIKLSSKLYQKNEEGKIVNLYTYYSEVNDLTFNEKSTKMEESLTFFFERYINDELKGEGKKTYLDYKATYFNNEKENLFTSDGKRVFLSSDYDNTYFNTYGDIVKEKALGYLNLKEDYLSLKKKQSLTYLIGIPLCFVLAYTIIYYLIPLILNRGKQTLGMKVTKTSLLSVDGFSCKAGRFTLRFLFKLLIILIGSFLAFFIPLAVSITMIVLLKTHQSLSEYVTNTYLISSDSNTVYKDLVEYKIAHVEIEKNNYIEKIAEKD